MRVSHANILILCKDNLDSYCCFLKTNLDFTLICLFFLGIPGDGRCLFRSVAHGACIRSGRPAPNESLQKELADDLRARVGCLLLVFDLDLHLYIQFLLNFVLAHGMKYQEVLWRFWSRRMPRSLS